MNSRRQAREAALQIMFQWEFLPNLDTEQSLKVFKANFEAPQTTWDYARQLVEGVRQKEREIDQKIEGVSAHWSLSRMPMVDRNIMRIATFEIFFGEEKIPPIAAINEAIEIAKKYSTTDSAAFINGVLDQLVKKGT